MNPLESNSLDSSVSYKLSNDFSTVKVNDIENVIAADRVQPRQVSTGVTRGTWRVVSNDGSYITVGLIPETNDEFGIAYWNSNGNLISKNDGTTETKYDTSGNILSIDNGNRTVWYDTADARIVIGKSPDDGRIGIWVSIIGQDAITNLGG